MQRAGSHLIGYGCKRCALEYTASIKLKNRIKANCSNCKKPFDFPISELKKGRKFCSAECANNKRTYLKEKKCVVCKIQFKPKRVNSKFCSIGCVQKFNTHSKEEVIKRFKEKYFNRYNYKSVKYTGMHNKIDVICKFHGVFKLTPNQHLQGKICSTCNEKEKKLKNKIVLDNKYKSFSSLERKFLSHTNYLNHIAKCKNCNDKFYFRIGRGNSFCSKSCSSQFYGKKKSNESLPTISSVTTQLKNLYNGKISIKKIDYGKSPKRHKGNFHCSIHGYFQYNIFSILNSSDCPFCSGRRINKIEFLELVNKKNNIENKNYDYSLLTDFDDGNAKRIFVCKKHGKFEQSIYRHLAGDGCRECSIEKRGQSNLEQAKKKWIPTAISIHGHKYDYSKSLYLGAKEFTEIICKIHGSFFQQPNNHLNGAGCPICANEIRALGDNIANLEKEKRYIEGTLYVIECLGEDEYFYKIGITGKSVEERFNNYLTMPYSYTPLLDIQIGLIQAFKHEQRILSIYEEYKYEPKIKFGGQSECLSMNPCEIDNELKLLLDVNYK